MFCENFENIDKFKSRIRYYVVVNHYIMKKIRYCLEKRRYRWLLVKHKTSNQKFFTTPKRSDFVKQTTKSFSLLKGRRSLGTNNQEFFITALSFYTRCLKICLQHETVVTVIIIRQ